MENKDTNFVQSEAKLIGAEGCYLCSIVKGIEHFMAKNGMVITPDLIRIYEKSVEYGFLRKDCYVLNPVAIMYLALGVSIDSIKNYNFITFNKTEADYTAKENEVEIARFENKKTCVTYSHFVEMEHGEVVYDPFGKSNTVAEGDLISKRIFAINVNALKNWYESLGY